MGPRSRRCRGGSGGLLALAAAVFAVGGCGPAAATAARPRPVAVTAVTAVPARGCEQTASGGTGTLTLRVGGRDRVARLHIPQGYRPERALSLVLDLHGSGSTAQAQESLSQFSRTADAHGFLVLYPQAFRRSGTGYSWNVPGTPSWQAAGPDEAAYLRQLVTTVSGRYCVEPAHVYGTGFSGGGREVSQLACERVPLFAAVAIVAGLRAPTPCPAGPVPVLAVHGTADAQNPYTGHGQPYWTYSVPEAAHRWAAHDGCAGAGAASSVPGATLTAYRDCRAGTAVELYTLAGKGHQWPSQRPGTFPANEVIWRFFAQHPRA